MYAPLIGRKARRKPRPPKICMGCPTRISHWKWLCDMCFAALPFHRRQAIAVAGQERKSQVVFGLCREGAEWLAEQHARAAE